MNLKIACIVSIRIYLKSIFKRRRRKMIVLLLGLMIFLAVFSYFIYVELTSSVFERLGYEDNDISIDKIEFVRWKKNEHKQ